MDSGGFLQLRDNARLRLEATRRLAAGISHRNVWALLRRSSAVGNREAQQAALEYFVSHRDMERFALEDFDQWCVPLGDGDAGWWSAEQEMHMLREVVRAFVRLRTQHAGA